MKLEEKLVDSPMDEEVVTRSIQSQSLESLK